MFTAIANHWLASALSGLLCSFNFVLPSCTIISSWLQKLICEWNGLNDHKVLLHSSEMMSSSHVSACLPRIVRIDFPACVISAKYLFSHIIHLYYLINPQLPLHSWPHFQFCACMCILNAHIHVTHTCTYTHTQTEDSTLHLSCNAQVYAIIKLLVFIVSQNFLCSQNSKHIYYCVLCIITNRCFFLPCPCINLRLFV